MLRLKIESVLSPNQQIRNNRQIYNMSQGTLPNLEVGKRYPDFYMIEPFIQEYDVDLTEVVPGDIIVRDWQYGHMENTGYRPVQVLEVFDNLSILVRGEGNITYTICVDPSLMRGRTYHKLNKDFLKIDD